MTGHPAIGDGRSDWSLIGSTGKDADCSSLDFSTDLEEIYNVHQDLRTDTALLF